MGRKKKAAKKVAKKKVYHRTAAPPPKPDPVIEAPPPPEPEPQVEPEPAPEPPAKSTKPSWPEGAPNREDVAVAYQNDQGEWIFKMKGTNRKIVIGES